MSTQVLPKYEHIKTDFYFTPNTKTLCFVNRNNSIVVSQYSLKNPIKTVIQLNKFVGEGWPKAGRNVVIESIVKRNGETLATFKHFCDALEFLENLVKQDKILCIDLPKTGKVRYTIDTDKFGSAIVNTTNTFDASGRHLSTVNVEPNFFVVSQIDTTVKKNSYNDFMFDDKGRLREEYSPMY